MLSTVRNIKERGNWLNNPRRIFATKKEYKIRLVLVIVLFVLSSILSILLIINLNRFIPLGATSMATVVPFNQFSHVPLWEEKKVTEAEREELAALMFDEKE